MAYSDLHDHLKKLEASGYLRRIQRVINKDTELHPLGRWQYRGGIPEEDRKAWLFENVTDAKGRRYKFPVVVGALAGNRAIYFHGMGCKTAAEVGEKWQRALSHPIAPVLVTGAPCQEEVHLGDELRREGLGMDEFPVPISTPVFDNGPYTTCSHWITKDPETGIQNLGNYRGQIKSPTRIGVFPSGLGQDIYIHWKKSPAKGEPLPAALVLGARPLEEWTVYRLTDEALERLAAEVDGGKAT